WLDVPNDDLWSDANAQGPCPAGWQVPTLDELTVLFNKHISTNFSGSRLRIPRDTGQSGDDLYLPAAGEISSSNGGGSSQDANGRYWSSTASNNNGMRFAFASAKYLQEFARANGYSVRCIQKQGRQ
ncbi:MAG: fibrobacter succinogenes major paralogous domain-containing protein, partial [Prevotella sp.]|nr:fibrobacter succinogenes major paralogous domain-containing protein [Prevotella sp.]